MKILFLQKRPVFPLNCGWRWRTLNVLRHLARRHDVTYLCNVQTGEDEAVEKMRALPLSVEAIPWRETQRFSPRFYFDLACNMMSGYPFTVTKDFHGGLRRQAARLLDHNRYDLVICDFVSMARNVMGLPMNASILFQHNVESQLLARQADLGSVHRRWYMHLQQRKMQLFEGTAGRAFDLVVAVSAADRETFEKIYGWSHVRTIDTAVDLEYFHPAQIPEVRCRVVFVGSLDWLPNEDAVHFFVSEIWPRIRAVHPEAECQIVGRRPSAAIRAYGRQPGVTIAPDVSDVRPYLAEATVVVVPLRVGGGTRLRVFEAMAMEKAVVSTRIGVEGLPVVDGAHLAIADEPDAFAAAVTTLLDDHRVRRRLSLNARSLVAARFSAEHVGEQFEKICHEAIERGRGRVQPSRRSVA